MDCGACPDDGMIMHKRMAAAACIAAIFGSVSATEQDHKLTGVERAQLQRDKLVLTGRSYRQIFAPYVFSEEPVFITTDSALNAWHVLFEESVRLVEERFSRELPGGLDKALDALPKEVPEGMTQEQFEPAVRRAKLVLYTASKLAGGKWRGGKELDDLVAADVRRAEEARETAMPEWLRQEGSPILGIDYAAFRPAGIYADSPQMAAYFRAVRWLQTVPFDLKRDDHLSAMAMIAGALDQTNPLMQISETFGEIAGSGAEIDVFQLNRRSLHSPFSIKTWMEDVRSEPEADPQHSENRPLAVVLAGRKLPDMEVFEKSTSPTRLFPDSLEAAVMFGSPLAKKLLENKKIDTTQRIAAREQVRTSPTIYGRYAVCLADLFAEPEPNAPGFMKSESWQRKSLNASLAGWAQFRHACTLQGRENVYYFGDGDSNPRGFVEPNPEFFRHLGNLATHCHDFFTGHDQPLSSLDVSRMAADLLPLIQDTIEPIRKSKFAEQQGTKLSEADERDYQIKMAKACKSLSFFRRVLGEAGEFMSVYGDSTGVHISSFDDPESLLPVIQKIADGVGINDVMTKLAPQLARDDNPDRWLRLVDICRQLETLAHKQLRGVEPAKDEVKFIQTYGERLAQVMLYDGNSWESPKDDAPRITAVFNQPGQGFLLAGIGRPREIRVLYPWKGQELECRGAVMPFLEMRSELHLTDSEWRDILDGSNRPQTPEWLQPVTTGK